MNAPSESTSEGLISLAEASARLGVTIHTTRRWVKEGKLKGYKLGDRTYRLNPADLDAFIQGKAVSTDV